MSLIQDLKVLESQAASMREKVGEQQNVYFKLINGMVGLHQKYRAEKNYALSDEIRSLLLSVNVKIIQGTSQYSGYDKIPDSLKGREFNDTWVLNKP